mmetsp:Transcript_12525/g.39583  ORF Transcript_12525/g.39583 Transcript_12525/m.39583 type:complete len:229 (-) Transcript_12525:325-1011(-)
MVRSRSRSLSPMRDLRTTLDALFSPPGDGDGDGDAPCFFRRSMVDMVRESENPSDRPGRPLRPRPLSRSRSRSRSLSGGANESASSWAVHCPTAAKEASSSRSRSRSRSIASAAASATIRRRRASSASPTCADAVRGNPPPGNVDGPAPARLARSCTSRGSPGTMPYCGRGSPSSPASAPPAPPGPTPAADGSGDRPANPWSTIATLPYGVANSVSAGRSRGAPGIVP